MVPTEAILALPAQTCPGVLRLPEKEGILEGRRQQSGLVSCGVLALSVAVAVEPLPQHRAPGIAVFVLSLFPGAKYIPACPNRASSVEKADGGELLVSEQPPISGVRWSASAYPQHMKSDMHTTRGPAEARVLAGGCSLRVHKSSSRVGFHRVGPTFTHRKPVPTTKRHASPVK